MWVIISGILGIAGFLISLINLINYFVSHKVNLEITMLEYAYKLGVQGKKRLFIHYKLNNKSQLPISVTDIQLILNGIEYTEDYNTHEVNSYHHKAKVLMSMFRHTMNICLSILNAYILIQVTSFL